jgi:hypothetical protein
VFWYRHSPEKGFSESLESLLNDDSAEAAKEEWWRNADKLFKLVAHLEILIANAKADELVERRRLLRRIKSGLDYIEGRFARLAGPVAPDPTEQARLLADLAYRAGAVLLWMHELHLADLQREGPDLYHYDAYDYLVRYITQPRKVVAGRPLVIALSALLRQMAELREARAIPTLGEPLNLSRIALRQTALEEIYFTNYGAESDFEAMIGKLDEHRQEFARILQMKKEMLIRQGMTPTDAEETVDAEMKQFIATQLTHRKSKKEQLLLEREERIERIIQRGLELARGGQ